MMDWSTFGVVLLVVIILMGLPVIVSQYVADFRRWRRRG